MVPPQPRPRIAIFNLEDDEMFSQMYRSFINHLKRHAEATRFNADRLVSNQRRPDVVLAVDAALCNSSGMSLVPDLVE